MKAQAECSLQNLGSRMRNKMEQSGMEWNAGESKTTITTAVSTGTDHATLSLTVIPDLSQHT